MKEKQPLDPSKESQYLKTILQSVDLDVNYRVLLFAGTVWAACRMNAWCFDVEEGELLQSISVHEKDLSSFFVIGKCLDYVAEHTPSKVPFLLSDPLGMVWIAEYAPERKGARSPVLFVFGPVFTSATSPLVIGENLENLHYSPAIRARLEGVLSDVPILLNSTIEQYARMLHFTLTGETCEARDFMLQKAHMEIDLFGEDKTADAHRSSLERAIAEEGRLLNMVREGRLDEKLLSTLRAHANPMEYAEGHPLRSAKDELILLCHKYTLVAEEQGLPSSVCRTLLMRYVQVIEKSRSHTELTELERGMTEDFVVRVRELKKLPEKSRDIMIAEEYIRSNLTKPLSIEEVADYVGYSGYYFTRKFARETGLKFTDYLYREKILYAQNLLKNSELPIQMISDMLQFSSLSYFGRVFKRETGQSPKDYRKGKEK